MGIFAAGYFIIINIVGLILMGVDKWKARHGKWRISERALFIVAILFGSVGILAGMLLFRHKTRKLRFTLGVPIILVVQLALFGFLFFWNYQQLETPSQVVQAELEKIKDLDEETVTSFVSYENLVNSNLSSGEINAATAEAVKEFFHSFTYSIHQETVKNEEATVTVQISNIDARALARDLCAEIMRRSVAIFPEDTAPTTSDYYELLRNTLLSNSYDTVVTTVLFHLKRENGRWNILADQELEDELVGGFISDINDPYILSASEVLAIHLDALKELSEDQWLQYLDIHDIFATGNSNYSAKIDREYAYQLKENFDYEIESCEENGPDATALVRIESLDMSAVLSKYRASLLIYAATTQSLQDSDASFSDETSSLLLDALTENSSATKKEVSLSFSNDGTTWEVYFNHDFINAVMGDIDTAVEEFDSLNDQS